MLFSQSIRSGKFVYHIFQLFPPNRSQFTNWFFQMTQVLMECLLNYDNGIWKQEYSFEGINIIFVRFVRLWTIVKLLLNYHWTIRNYCWTIIELSLNYCWTIVELSLNYCWTTVHYHSLLTLTIIKFMIVQQ